LSILQSILLGLVQGLTEFLPVSSSGHLVLAKYFLGIQEKDIAFEVIVHFGTLLAIITAFRKELLDILADCVRYVSGAKETNAGPEMPAGVRMFLFIVVGMIPAGLVGFLFEDVFESVFSNPVFVSIALIFTGILLTLTRLAPEKTRDLTVGKAFLIGVAQILALFPGVSRSGTTITTGLLLGVKGEEAARYSFLMVIPLIFGATLLQSFKMLANPPSASEALVLGIGCLSAYLSGLWAIKWLLAVVQHGRFARFAYYCFALGTLGLVMRFTA